jgi:hypothetical protein
MEDLSNLGKNYDCENENSKCVIKWWEMDNYLPIDLFAVF